MKTKNLFTNVLTFLMFMLFTVTATTNLQAQYSNETTTIRDLPAPFKAEASLYGEEITMIPQHTEVTLLDDYKNIYVKIKYKNKEGWVSYNHLELTDNMVTKLGNKSEIKIKAARLSSVLYEVKCSPAGFDVTYTNNGGNTEQMDVSRKEWKQHLDLSSDDYVYLSAQAKNEDARITVKIYYNGRVIEKAQSSGDYVVVSASSILK